MAASQPQLTVVSRNDEPTAAPAAPPKKTRQQHAEEINRAWQKGVESVIQTGRLVQLAKDDLVHGEFLAMVETDLPFGEDMAQRLMAIARNPVLSNADHGRYLLRRTWR